MRLTPKHLALLQDVAAEPISTLVFTGRAHVSILEDLVSLGLATAHRSSIGETDEKATFSATDAGRAMLARK